MVAYLCRRNADDASEHKLASSCSIAPLFRKSRKDRPPMIADWNHGKFGPKSP